MILQIAIVNLTRNLDIISQKKNQSVSSNVKLKEKALSCLAGLIDKAPDSEYIQFGKSQDYSILTGYLINILCKLGSNDKSRSIRSQSFEILSNLTCRLERIHQENGKECSLNPIVLALPGVSSSLFKLIMSDTKLPKSLLTIAVRILTKFITVTFLHCNHRSLARKDILDICDNLAIRMSFLIDYITTNAQQLAEETLLEVLNLCQAIVCETDVEFLNRSIKTLVKYIAFISSSELKPEVKLKLMIINDNICEKIKNSSDIEIITCLFKMMDELHDNYDKLLSGERQSQLSIISGLFRLLPNDSLTIVFESNERREQFVRILSSLTEFTTDQPFLFLSDVEINKQAIENLSSKLYTFEKRFKHINNKDLETISDICSIVGQNLDWLYLSDLLKNDLRQFTESSNLFITNLIFKGCLKREDLKFDKFSKLTKPNIEFYIEKIHEGYLILNEDIQNDLVVDLNDILKVVIAIETVETLIGIHVKNSQSKAETTIVLKDLLCYLLNWASASSRAISETSLVALNQISLLYGKDSTKGLIEDNIDYVVDGIMRMLDGFAYNSEITNVLAITFKLSSIESFYYFRDVYEKIFKLLATYHSTVKSKSIALLFYRTVTILNEWKEVKQCQPESTSSEIPLNCDNSIKSILNDIDVRRRLKRLEFELLEAEKIRNQMDTIVTKEDEDKVIKEIQTGKVTHKEDDKEKLEGDGPEAKEEDENSSKKKKKPVDVELTEKILQHCANLASSNYDETKILALKTASCGFNLLRDDDDTLLPLVHQLWSPLIQRLTKDYSSNLELNLCAFECLISMAICAKDFIKGRALETIIPKICLFLESQAQKSKGKSDYGPYCMTIAYKCQLKVLTHLGALAYHIELAYTSLWRVIRAILAYMDQNQALSLRNAAKISLHYLIALDADCTWFFAKESGHLCELPFELIYDNAG